MPELTNAEWQELQRRLTRIETMLETEAARCPHREQIARSANNTLRLAQIESELDGLRVDMARATALGGGVGAALSAIAMGILRAMGLL